LARGSEVPGRYAAKVRVAVRVFVAGSTGAIGKSLVPLLVESGNEVAALVRTAAKGREVEALGAKPVVADALDKEALTSAVVEARPEAILHELTALSGVTGDFKKLDEEFALTNRLRTEVTDTLLAAARLVGTRRFIAQSFCGWPFAREGGPVKTEEDPLDPDPPSGFGRTLAAIRYLEEAVRGATDIEAFALRYGILYGPGTVIAKDGAIVELIRKRRIPIVGAGAGVWSFVHVRDAARATEAAISRGAPGTYNIVDDEPAPVSNWLPLLANVLGAKPPRRVPVWLARSLIGEGGVSMMTKIRGGSNAKAKRELGWELAYPTWRSGFAEGLG
jgi:nucleoside-diphosphate-sugar epimerase